MDIVKSAQGQMHSLVTELCIWWEQMAEEEKKLSLVAGVSMGLLGFAFLAYSFNKSLSNDKKQKEKKKSRSGSKSKPEVKLTPYEFSERQLNSIMAKVSSDILPKLQDFLNEAEQLKDLKIDKKIEKPTKRRKKKSKPKKLVEHQVLEQLEYKRRYFNEILLKELMNLDGVDTLGDVTLRNRRRECVRQIQGYHRGLDAMKALLGDLAR